MIRIEIHKTTGEIIKEKLSDWDRQQVFKKHLEREISLSTVSFLCRLVPRKYSLGAGKVEKKGSRLIMHSSRNYVSKIVFYITGERKK